VMMMMMMMMMMNVIDDDGDDYDIISIMFISIRIAQLDDEHLQRYAA